MKSTPNPIDAFGAPPLGTLTDPSVFAQVEPQFGGPDAAESHQPEQAGRDHQKDDQGSQGMAVMPTCGCHVQLRLNGHFWVFWPGTSSLGGSAGASVSRGSLKSDGWMFSNGLGSAASST